MISHKHKCIFVHIPKTAGSSIENVIWPLESDRVVENLCKGAIKPYYNKYQTGGLQHLTSNYIKTEVGDDIFNSYYKFSVIRNPWEKAVSQYVYMKQKRKDLRRFIGMTRWTSFKKYLSLISEKTYVQWMKQVDFLMDANGEIMVDKIIRFENLEEEFLLVKEHLGISDVQLPHVNKSNRKSYQSFYDKESMEMVLEMYKEDVDAFNYTFDE